MDRENELKKLRMRSWRRGMKEMDLILGPFADEKLAEMSPEDIALYEVMLTENDQELYQWVLARMHDRSDAGPPQYRALLDRISAEALGRLQPEA